MNEQLLKATLKVITDGQAYLYAHALQVDWETLNPSNILSSGMFEAWEDEWKKETAELILKAVSNEEKSNSD
jgi:hypothetical protein